MDKLVDFSQPIEAYHADGRVVALEPDYHFWPDREGDYSVKPVGWGVPLVWQRDGSPWMQSARTGGWRIRNTAKPSTPSNEELTQRMEIAPEMIERMIALTEEVARSMIPGTDDWYRRAKAIVSDLPKPVDPIDSDLLEAREMEASGAEANGLQEYADMVRAGRLDDEGPVRCTLAGIKRGRTLAAGGPAHE